MAQERAQGNGQLEEEVVELLTVVSQKRESVLARAKVRLREASGFIALAAFIVAVLAAATLFWSNIRENINQEIVQSEQHTSGRIDRMEQRLSGIFKTFTLTLDSSTRHLSTTSSSSTGMLENWKDQIVKKIPLNLRPVVFSPILRHPRTVSLTPTFS